MSRVDDLVDSALEALIAPSFTKVGYEVRRRLDEWTPIDGYDLRGRTYVVTGATSGLGLAASEVLARAGAEVLVVGRSAEKTERVVDELRDRTGSTDVQPVVADMGDLDQVRAAAAAIRTGRSRLAGLLHNAGALDHERRTTSTGIEATIASQVVGPFLLTSLLLDLLRAAEPGRVVTMSSGGMYAAALTVDESLRDGGPPLTEVAARSTALRNVVDNFNKSQQNYVVKVESINFARIDNVVIQSTAAGPGRPPTAGVGWSASTRSRTCTTPAARSTTKNPHAGT